MRKPDLSELEALIAAAEAKATEPVSTTPARDRHQALRASRERASAIVVDALGHIDVDSAELDRLVREHDVELRRVAEDAKRRAIEGSAETSQRLEALVTAQRDALDALPANDPWLPGTFILPSVLFIRSWPTAGNLRDSHLEPSANWAKYAIKDSGGSIIRRASEKASFYILWQNPRDVAVLADIYVRLTVNGHGESSAEGGGVSAWFFPDSRSDVDVSARLTIWPLWTAHTAQLPIQTVPLESLTAKGGFFGDSEGASISTTLLVGTTRFAIPAEAYILIEASVAVDYELLNGGVDVDFASSDQFRVGCPYGFVVLAPEMNVNP